MSDSAFRRLLLDTVSTAVSQPPSSSSLINLLRIATPSLLASHSDEKQRLDAEARVRDAPQREKLFRSLQSRIHPDKHAGEERATVLFQEVTNYYGKCIEAMENEDTRKRQSGGTTDATKHSNDPNSGSGNVEKDAPGRRGDDRSGPMHSRFPKWSAGWYRQQRQQNPRRSRADIDADASTHSEYENCDYDDEQPQRRRPWGRRKRNSERDRDREPSNHQAFAFISLLLFPPLGLCALIHSLRVGKAWDDGRYREARHHSRQAYNYAWYGCLCFACIVIYLWLSDGDADWDWDKVKRNFEWDNGP